MKVFCVLLFFILGIKSCEIDDRDPSPRDCLGYKLDKRFFDDTTKLIYKVFVHQIYHDSLAYTVEELQEAIDSFSDSEEPNTLNKENIFFKVIGTRSGEFWRNHNVIDSSEQLPLWKLSVSNFESFTDLNKKRCLNLYLTKNDYDDFKGSAGTDIPTVNCAVQRQYLWTSSTIHELLHCLGCLHTHESDMTDGLNTKTGDKVCDTPSSPELRPDLTRFCDFVIPGLSKRKSRILNTNLMSYSNSSCRNTLTTGQGSRIRRTTELNPQIYRTLLNLDNDKK